MEPEEVGTSDFFVILTMDLAGGQQTPDSSRRGIQQEPGICPDRSYSSNYHVLENVAGDFTAN